MSLGTLLTVAMEAPDAVANTKRYSQMQRQRRQPGQINQKIPQIGTHAPGGAPPMRKVSSPAGLNLKKKLMEKQAAKPPEPFGIGRALLVGAGLAGGGLAARGVAGGVAGLHTKFKANRMFKELQQRYPEIRRHKDARKYFDLVVAYAPSLMRHHAAIGDFLRRQLEYPMSSVEFIKQLADLEATVAKTEGSGTPAQFGKSVTEQAQFGWQPKV